ncbi:hypothetical protein WDZ92_32230, partial [Nostoc sp. NIES-2111]
QKTLVNTSGDGNGSIALQGRRVFISGGSVILNQNFGFQPSGDITVDASESLKLSGTSIDGKFISNLQTESLGFGKAADINVFTPQVVIERGGRITSKAFGIGRGGNINVASESTQLSGFSSFDPFITSAIVTTAASSSLGNAGNITLSTGYLLAKDGSVITSLNLGNGSGGSVLINAKNTIELINSIEFLNSEPGSYIYSYLSSETANAGNAGNLTINTSKLLVGNKATINTITRGFGSAGIVTINASEIEVNGSINSSAIKASLIGQQLFGAPAIPSGSPGEIIINSNKLKVANGGTLSVTNQGTSTAGGILTINANTINMSNKASINASTVSGEGGNIWGFSSFLSLDDSRITATAGGSGNGGNIILNTSLLIGSNNSQIIANAFLGRGGKIQINAQGVFLSPNTQVSSKSQRGIDGTVDINANVFLAQTPVKSQTVQESPKIASVCPGISNTNAVANRFVIKGRESAPISIDEPLYNQAFLETNSVAVKENESLAETQVPKIEEPTQIVEAQGWVIDAKGQITLVATKSNDVTPNSVADVSSCSSVTQIFPSIESVKNE